MSRTARHRPASAALSWRARIALLLLVVGALLPALGIGLQLRDAAWLHPGDDPMAAFERRLAPVREALRGESDIGYLPPADSLDAAAAAAHFYMTRYALSPVLVENELSHDLIIADGVADPSRLPPRLAVVRDFGGGLLLLRPRSE